jgi:23S rRNA (cytidine1920-2'-O)/16S rRNA (cytidine1409-2'-O)-methyltransferase
LGRVDLELVARGLAPSRSAAQRLIADGAVFTAPDMRIDRPSRRVGAHDRLWVESSDETRFVSRAGAKLHHALRDTGVDPRGRVVLDLGMSTGGFADCLLQAGAARVVGIEVGHGQLHPKLRDDPRVSCLERTNLREATPERVAGQVADAPPEGFPMAVADLSFISLTKVLPAIDALLAPQATALLLVKPQFELSADALDRRGVVVDDEDRARALESVARTCVALGWTVHGAHDSALPGGDGNREFFLHASTPAARAAPPDRPRQAPQIGPDRTFR